MVGATINERLKTRTEEVLTHLTRKNWSLFIILSPFALSIYLLLAIGVLFYPSMGPGLDRTLESALELIYGMMNFVVLALLAGALIWVYRNVRKNWAKLNPPYKEELVILRMRNPDFEVFVFRNHFASAIVGVCLNGLYIILLYFVWKVFQTYKSTILSVIDITLVGTREFNSYYKSVLSVLGLNVQNLNPETILAYLLVTMGFVFFVQFSLNIEYIIRKQIVRRRQMSTKNRGAAQYTRFKATKLFMEDYLGVLMSIIYILRLTWSGELKKECRRFIISSISLIIPAFSILLFAWALSTVG